MDAASASAATNGSRVDPTTQPLSSVIIDNSGAITEDEAALYDRQIRLWGLESQNRLRTSHILIVGWNGIATEIVKNTVLSGVGSITILDPTPVDASIDLLSGFFFRDNDVGQPKCSHGPLDRVRALNPLVKVHGVSEQADYETLIAGGDDAESWLRARKVDVLVIGTPLPPAQRGAYEYGLQERLVMLNDTSRKVGVKFFLSSTYGFGGFYFADQITHDYIVERTAPASSATTNSTSNGATEEKKRIKQRQAFVPLSASLSHTWPNLTDRQQRRIKLPLDWFIWLALTDLQSRLTNDAPTTSIGASALKNRTIAMIKEKGLNPDIILPPSEGGEVETVFEDVVRTGGAGVTLAPVESVLGGVLSQDILNSISGREEPVVNWLLLNSDASGAATVHKIGYLGNAMVVD
ncbi:hypothetical protein NDA16_000611 [Ustilago loliicola]|nr:hypothetical protein NDA16_000611 [Ustilago loliicola]